MDFIIVRALQPDGSTRIDLWSTRLDVDGITPIKDKHLGAFPDATTARTAATNWKLAIQATPVEQVVSV